jgi:hypothetical protein
MNNNAFNLDILSESKNESLNSHKKWEDNQLYFNNRIEKLLEKQLHIQERIDDLIVEIDVIEMELEKKDKNDFKGISKLEKELEQLNITYNKINKSLILCQKEISLNKLEHSKLQRSIIMNPISSSLAKEKSRSKYKKKLEDFVNLNKDILLSSKLFLSHMIEDAANKGVRNLHIGHYLSFQGFKKIAENNLINIRKYLIDSANYIKDILNINDIYINIGEKYEQDINMIIPYQELFPTNIRSKNIQENHRIGNYYFDQDERLKNIFTKYKYDNNNNMIYLLKNIPNCNIDIYILLERKQIDQDIFYLQFTSLFHNINGPLFLSSIQNNEDVDQRNSYNKLYLSKFIHHQLLSLEDITCKSILDNPIYSQDLFEFFVFHDNILQINFKSTSLMKNFIEEENSISSLNQVLLSTDLSTLLECDLNQNGYLVNIDENKLISIIKEKSISNNIEFSDYGYNVVHNLNKNDIKMANDPLFRLQEMYMFYFDIFNIFSYYHNSIKFDLWNEFKTEEYDFICDMKSKLPLDES